MNHPYGKKDQYKFVYEFLEILGIKSEDIVLIYKHTIYRKVFLSSSYTHGHDSNAPPRKEIFEFFDKIKELALHDYQPKVNLPAKFYISRRSWVHGDTSNIGTNYTSRRCLANENELVETLVLQDFEEIFTETMSTRDKIALFNQAKVIIGAIGGGTCNVIFSNRSTKLFCLVSPNFLTINSTKSINFLNNSTSQIYFWRENESMAFIVNKEGQKVFGVMDVCNGLDLIFIYVSIIVLLPFSVKRKILFSLLGAVVLTFANVFRITCLFFISKYYHPAFDISHHYLFTALMYILIFYGWLLFIKTKPMQP
jgi:exosortase/archaeosortase family protein